MYLYIHSLLRHLNVLSIKVHMTCAMLACLLLTLSDFVQQPLTRCLLPPAVIISQQISLI